MNRRLKDFRLALLTAETSMSAIAREVGVSHQAVHAVAMGQWRSRRIEDALRNHLPAFWATYLQQPGTKTSVADAPCKCKG